VLSVPRDGVQLTVPPGAVDQPLTIHYQRTAAPPPGAQGRLPLAFTLTAWDSSGRKVHTFRKLLQLTLQYPAAPFVREQGLQVFFSPDYGTWSPMPTQVAADSNQLRVELDHFTHFAAIGPSAQVGDIVTLCAGTEIRQGPGLAVHTIVPVEDWEVLITERRDIAGEIWWNVDRKALDHLPTSGTGWVSQSQADSACLVTGDEGDPTQVGLLPLTPEQRALLRALGYPWPWIDEFMQGDPVYPPTGNFVLRREDLQIPGVAGTSFDFGWIYNSRDARIGTFGRGMSSLLDMSARIAIDGSIDIRYPDGHGAFFQAQGDRYVPGDRGIFDQLELVGDRLRLTTPDQWIYELTVFDPSSALLTEIRNRNGNRITLMRDDEGRVNQIFDSANRPYDLTYDEDRVTSITDISDRSIEYHYDGDTLHQVIDGNHNTHTFVFRNDRLEDLVDPLNVRYLSNRYDGEGRVTNQFDAQDRPATFVYNDRETIFTDYLQNTTITRYDERDRVVEVVDALQQPRHFTYGDDDNRTSITDERDHTWQFDYNAQGRLLHSTDPLSYTISYTYNAANDLTSVTDQGGRGNTRRTIRFTPDPQGNVTLIVLPDITTIEATYDERGQLRTLTNPRKLTTTFDYDAQGNQISVADPLNQTTTFTHDVVGRLRTRTDAEQRISRFRYDGNDNLIEVIDPKLQPTLLDYDGNDSLTRMIDRRRGITAFTYDYNLKLVSVTDPGKHTTSFEHDAMGNRTKMIDPRDNVTLYRYDPIYRLVEIEDALQQVTKLRYDPTDNLERIIDPLTQATQFDYDPLNRPTEQVDALLGRTSLDYDAVGRVTRHINQRGAETLFTYDLRDRLVLTEDALQGRRRLSYDPNGNVIGAIDANDNPTSATYDAADRLLTVTDAGQHTTSYRYDRVGNTTVMTDALGFATRFAYDPNDNLETITDALAGVTHFEYDAEDALIALIDANNNPTRLVRDLDGLIRRVIEAGSQTSRFDYDPTHNLETFTNAKGKIWRFTYDELNRRTEQHDPLDQLTRYEYDPLGRLIREINARSITTRYDYDPLNRLTTVVENERADRPADHETNVAAEYTYDPVDNLVAIRDANGNTTEFEYDLLDRLTREINPLNAIWEYRYDPVGNLIERRDANGASTDYGYDADNLLKTINYSDGDAISFTYDAVHSQIEMRDGLGLTRNIYDPLRRLSSQTNHLGQRVGYQYDAVGNRTAMIYPDGRAMRYRYDVTNFVDQVRDPQEQIFAVTRDLTHKIVAIDNPNGTQVTHSYDDLDRLTGVRNLAPDGAVISSFAYTLDPVGNRTRTNAVYSWRKPETLTTGYSYDPLDRLVRSSDSGGHFNEYSYDAVGNQLRHITNDDPTLTRAIDTTTTTASFNDANQLISTLRETAPRGNPDRTQQTSLALRAFVHELDAQHGKHIDTMTADSLRAMASALLSDLESGNGPPTDTTATRLAELRAAVESARDTGRIDNAGVANSLLVKLDRADDANTAQGGALSVALYDYDANGNRVQRTQTDDDTANERDWLRTDYAYDTENRLLNVGDFRNPGSGNWQPGDLTKLTYDGYGRLFRRMHDQRTGGGGQKWTEYVYDGLDPVVEYLEPSPQYINYYRGLGSILSMRPFRSQQDPNGTIDYFHYDGLGSVSALTKHAGQRAHTYRYADYGTIVDVNGKAADASNFTDPHNHYTYTGQEWDEQTGLLHFYAREYEPATGVWLQPDPYRGRIAAPETLHRYGYVGQNPIGFVDLWGFDRVSTTIKHVDSLMNSYHNNARTSLIPVPTPEPNPGTGCGSIITCITAPFTFVRDIFATGPGLTAYGIIETVTGVLAFNSALTTVGVIAVGAASAPAGAVIGGALLFAGASFLIAQGVVNTIRGIRETAGADNYDGPLDIKEDLSESLPGSKYLDPAYDVYQIIEKPENILELPGYINDFGENINEYVGSSSAQLQK
jgi:RHS repeat-associated protein